MNKVDKLDNIQLVVSELVSSIKQDIHKEEVVTNESISYLTRRVEKLNSCDSQCFTAGYNILVLKQAINTLNMTTEKFITSQPLKNESNKKELEEIIKSIN